MSEFRSAAETFVSEFLDYIYKHDILDEFDSKTQKMQRSAGVEALIKKAQGVFPPRADDGQKENAKLSDEKLDEAIKTSPNIVDTREMFSHKVAANGGVRSMLRALYKGEPDAHARVAEFLAAEDGEKEFAKKE